MKFNYNPPSFGTQREVIGRKLKDQVPTEKLGRKRYFRELLDTWAVLSPFGYGEITLKDFEAFLCGNVLIKPDMSHMETWPPLYQAWKTYVPIKWDLSDLEAVLADVEGNRRKYLPIAKEGQRLYLEHLSGVRADELFSSRFASLIERATLFHQRIP